MKYWTPEIKSSVELKHTDKRSNILYSVLQTDVPLTQGRDICYRQCFKKLHDGSYIGLMESIDDPICPNNPDLIRMTFFNAVHVSKQSNGKTLMKIMDMEVTGGSLPKWIFNLIMPTFLIEEIEHITDFFKKGNVKYASIC
jgi:hypothetical protein